MSESLSVSPDREALIERLREMRNELALRSEIVAGGRGQWKVRAMIDADVATLDAAVAALSQSPQKEPPVAWGIMSDEGCLHAFPRHEAGFEWTEERAERAAAGWMATWNARGFRPSLTATHVVPLFAPSISGSPQKETKPTDAERLDWLEREASKRAVLIDWLDESREEFALYEPANYLDPSLGENDHSWRVLYNYFVGKTTLRSAIDASMSQSDPDDTDDTPADSITVSENETPEHSEDETK